MLAFGVDFQTLSQLSTAPEDSGTRDLSEFMAWFASRCTKSVLCETSASFPAPDLW